MFAAIDTEVLNKITEQGITFLFDYGPKLLGAAIILFIGLLHRVDELLEGKVELRPLIRTLPFGADLWRRLREGEGHGK